MATNTRLLTAEEFLHMPEPPDGSKEELVRGEIVMTPPPNWHHGRIQLRIGSILLSYCDATKLGRATTESGVITERDPDSVRGPDVAFWSFERLPAGEEPSVYPEACADLCVEVLSPDDRPKKVQEKIDEYLARGVRLVWKVDPVAQTVTEFLPTGRKTVFAATDRITGRDVLPGFDRSVANWQR